MDVFTETLSHELAERMSDTTGGLKYNSPLGAKLQIGDGEPDPGNGNYSYLLNGYMVQSYFSNRNGGDFLVYGAGAQGITLTPSWSNSTFNGTYSLTLNAPANGQVVIGFLNDQVHGNLLTVSINGEVATFVPNTSSSTAPNGISSIFVNAASGSKIIVKAGVVQTMGPNFVTTNPAGTWSTLVDGSLVFVSP
jgi:hypothetical protein